MHTELLDLEKRYTRLTDGDDDVDFNENDYKRLMQLRQDHADTRKAIYAEAAAIQAAEAAARAPKLRGVSAIKASLDQRKAAHV